MLVLSVFVGRNVDFLPTVFALYALAVYRSARSAWIAYAQVTLHPTESLAAAGVFVAGGVVLLLTVRARRPAAA